MDQLSAWWSWVVAPQQDRAHDGEKASCGPADGEILELGGVGPKDAGVGKEVAYEEERRDPDQQDPAQDLLLVPLLVLGAEFRQLLVRLGLPRPRLILVPLATELYLRPVS